jgi:hypothetical protein
MEVSPPARSRKAKMKDPSSSDMFSAYAPLSTSRKRSNSTSSIATSYTVHEPDLDKLLLGVATMVHCQMVGNMEVSKEVRDKFHYFSEESFHDAKKETLQTKFPSVGDILRFFSHCYRVANFRPESAVILLVYVNRLMGADVPLTLHNWKPITVTALLLSQKLWDDTPLINSDFCILYPALTTVRVNFLERVYLRLLGFKLAVPLSLYAQYYFELLSVADESEYKKSDAKAPKKNHDVREHVSKIYRRNKKHYAHHTGSTDMLIHRRARIILPF